MKNSENSQSTPVSSIYFQLLLVLKAEYAKQHQDFEKKKKKAYRSERLYL
jgi:hypothetical protein